MTGALRVLEHHLTVYRRTWKGSVFMSFVSPVLFLTAMGLGLGSLISRGPVRTVDGVSYVAFLAPGLLAATAMQSAYVETTYPIMARMQWLRTYDGMLAVLTGLAFGAPIFAFTATQRTDTSFALIGRLLITPLFLLGGVFFPIHQLPQLVQGIAWITPLAHGVALARGLAVGAASPTAGIHLAVLLAYAAIGIVAAGITLQRRLVP